MAKTEIIAYHGWGFDRTCWESWKDRAIAEDDRFQCFDRGYYGNPCNPEFLPLGESIRVIVAHSYGLHLCPKRTLQQADVVMILGGFQTFHPFDSQAQRRSQRILIEMMRQFKQSPAKVLHSFMENCYSPESNPFPKSYFNGAQLNTQLLYKDLENLSQTALQVELLEKKSQVLMVHGGSDRIVAPQQVERFAGLLSNARLILIQSAGHALPFTHTGDCHDLLRSLIPK